MNRLMWVWTWVMVLAAGVALVSTPASAQSATEVEIDDAIDSGVAWLVAQQADNGSWQGGYVPGPTGMGLAVLGHYAERMDMLPLDAEFPYRDAMQAGLNFIFASAYHDDDNERVWFYQPNIFQSSNYAAGPALMGIVLSGTPNRIVDVEGSAVYGLTYRDVAQRIVNTLAHVQLTAGTAVGSWDYTPNGTSGDLSTAGWVSLGIGYARDRFGISLPASLVVGIDAHIDQAQQTANEAAWQYGGAGYRSYDGYASWINSHKVGHLLYMMYLVGDGAETPRVQRSLGFLERYWDSPTSGSGGGQTDAGWRGAPPGYLPSYIGTATITKGLVAMGLDVLDGADWFADISTVVVQNQHADDYWDQGGYPSGVYYRELSTMWALLTLLRAAPLDPLMDNWRNLTTTSGDFLATSGMGGTGYYIVVARGATPPTEAQIDAGVDYADVTVVRRGSGAIAPDVERVYSVTGLQPETPYDLWFVVKDDEDNYSRVLRSPFQTLSALMTPSGGILVADRLSPFHWPAVEGATWYRIWINRHNQPIYVKWLPAPPKFNFPLHGMPGGNYRWWVQSWSPASGHGEWIGPADFTVENQTPGTITQIAPQGAQDIADMSTLTYRWTLDPTATWYQIWIGKRGSGEWYRRWHQFAGTGEAAMQIAGHPHGNGTWWIRGWCPDGYGPWSGLMAFSVPDPAPAVPTLINPHGAVASPVMLQYASARAEWFRVYVTDNKKFLLDTWTTDTTHDLGDLPEGRYLWWIGAWNEAGSRIVWSARAEFTVGVDR